MDPGSRSRSSHPIARMHWVNAICKYGYKNPDVIKQQWETGCGERIKFRFDVDHKLIYATVGGISTVTISYENCEKVVNLIKQGYSLKKTLFCKDDRIGALCLVGKTVYLNKTRKHVILAVDLKQKEIMACVDVQSYTGKENLHHVEVWECDVSPDNNIVLLSVGLLIEQRFAFEACENFVSVYNKKQNCEIRRIWNWDNIICGLGFDPRSTYDRYAVVGMRASIKEKSSLELRNIDQESPLTKVSVEQYIDREGETYFQIVFSRDGEHILLQVIENVAYAREWQYKTFIYKNDTLDLLSVCQPTYAISCHVDCVPCTLPVMSVCGSYIALGNFDGLPNGKRKVEIDLYRLPTNLNLKNACRATILRIISSDDITKLGLPASLQNYLLRKIT